MTSVIIAGGGKGRRLNNRSKAFLKIGNKELLFFSLDFFYPIVEETIIVLPAKRPARTDKILQKKYPGIKIASGGKQRQDSVKKGLEVSDNKEGIILVHDVARPFPRIDMVKRVIRGARKYGACIPCIEMQDTVKNIENNFVKETLARDSAVRIQTPQAFRAELLITAHHRACEENFHGSDDSLLVERTGAGVYATAGSIENIKITYPLDIETANAILKKWKKTA